MTQRVSLTVNGRPVEAAVEPRTHLADFVRDTLHLTGTHLGCEHGVCGACTMLVDGAPIRSCIAQAVACDGADVRTVEGFDDDPLMQALREAFTRHHALQCGYCTPGMLITAYDVVQRLPGANEARVREELSGNLCRCTGYVGIVDAVRSVLADPPSRDTTVRPPQGPAPVETSSPLSPDSAGPRGVGHATRTDIAGAGAETPDSSPEPHDASFGMPPDHASATPRTTGSEHEVALAIAPETLWPVLRDVATVVRCLPGASLNGPASADPLSVAMTVAIGPMRARFEGAARAVFDDRQRTAAIEGSGHDARSRTTSEGRIELSVRPSPTGGAVLSVRLRYALKGPLAQFSRGALVDAVVEQLLGRFADNLSSAAAGREIAAAPIGGFGLTVAAIRGRLRRWLAGHRR